MADVLARFGTFDVVFCYGLLYHLENPVAGIRNLAAVTKDLLLLESVVLDHPLPLVRLEDEPRETTNQAVGGIGCRPSPAFITMALNGFEFVYAPLEPPAYPDFQFSWKGNLESARENHLLRCIFVGTRTPLENPRLALLFSGPTSIRGNPSLRPGDRILRVRLDTGGAISRRISR